MDTGVFGGPNDPVDRDTAYDEYLRQKEEWERQNQNK